MNLIKKEILKKIEKLINKYLRDELKVRANIDKEWREESLRCKKMNFSVRYPKIYSNQYFAFIELENFWNELKEKLT